MRLFLCWVCPPLAVLSCGRPFSAVLNFFLWCFFWFPGTYHATAVVERYYNDQRNKKMLQVANYPAWTQHVFAAQPDQRMQLPKSKGKRRQALPEPESQVYNDPSIGENGTRFRRRNRG